MGLPHMRCVPDSGHYAIRQSHAIRICLRSGRSDSVSEGDGQPVCSWGSDRGVGDAGECVFESVSTVLYRPINVGGVAVSVMWRSCNGYVSRLFLPSSDSHSSPFRSIQTHSISKGSLLCTHSLTHSLTP